MIERRIFDFSLYGMKLVSLLLLLILSRLVLLVGVVIPSVTAFLATNVAVICAKSTFSRVLLATLWAC